jgi:NTP pyrophosphatase (non-canonical NTP hydrolase)
MGAYGIIQPMKDFEGRIRQYLTERKWDDLRPADLAKSISIEAAELLELFQWTNQSLEEVKKDKDKVEAIKKELADVLIYCFDMSVLLELDTETIVSDKLEKAIQKYPAHLFNARNEKDDAGSEEVYWKIKKEHRMRGE